MKLLHLVLILTAYFTIVVSAVKSSVFETALKDYSPWTQGDLAHHNLTISLQILLHQHRSGEFEQHAINIATPGHPEYGRLLSRDDVQSYLRPSRVSIDAVKSWLHANALQNENNYEFLINYDIIQLYLPVEQAEFLFNTSLYYFTNHNGDTIVRALEYSLPDSLHQHIKTVLPITRFPDLLPQFSTINEEMESLQMPPSFGYDPSYCNRTILPFCIQGLYQLNNYTPPLNTGINIGISGYLNQTADLDSLHSFIATYVPYFPQVFPTLLSTDGSALRDPLNTSSQYTTETSLDLQYSSSIAPSIPITFYSTSGVADGIRDADQPVVVTNEPYMKQLIYLLSLPDDQLPSVLSTSYGENEQSVPYGYANATCNMFAQLGARGVSVIFSSGDSGPGSACRRNDGSNATTFNPIFPASCPFVTSVGGTQFVDPEAAASFSSGGFSDYFSRPAYQNDVVTSYLKTFNSSNPNAEAWKDFYNPNGRGFPDVSAQSFNFIIIDHMRVQHISGTSAAAPVFAGMIANLNALRVSSGLPKLGFLNPWLYSDGLAGFSDVTVGGSMGCTGTSQYSYRSGNYVPYASWNATVGWDPVTGIGTPMWPRLVEVGLRNITNTTTNFSL